MIVFKTALCSILLMFVVLEKSNAQCPTPSNLQTSYSNDVTTLSWNAVNGATSYIVEAKQFFDTWSQAAVVATVNTNTYAITGIMHSLTFDWRVKAVCTSGSSAYDSTRFVVPCPLPTAPSATNITTNSAQLNWSPAAGYKTFVSDFAVAYRPLGSNTWISLGRTSDSTMNVANLTANTTYEWCVNQTCPYFNSSPLISTFTTAGCPSAGNNNTEWISRFKLNSINRYSGAENGGYVQTNISTSLSAGSRYRAKIQVGNNGSFSKKRFSVYIDYNDDGIYSTTELLTGPKTIKNTNVKNFRVTIPSNAPSGTHGMRVIMLRKGTTITGCINGHNGETEDYLVNIYGGSNKGALSVQSQLNDVAHITASPNPTSNNVTISSDKTIETVDVYNITGQKILTKRANAKKVDIDIHQLASGMYIIRVNNTHSMRVMKR